MVARSTMSDLSGRIILDGRFELVRMMGAGSYGVVYAAIDLAALASTEPSSTTSLKRYAIKVLRKDTLSSSASARVRREIALHRKMSDHPNIVCIHSVGEDDDYVYIVLDYCPGGDMFGKIKTQKLYFRRDELLKSVFLQILDAVEACHKKGIYHRDLKPENILTNHDGSKIWLADFGLSTDSEISEVWGCGSSYYMSPGKHHAAILNAPSTHVFL